MDSTPLHAFAFGEHVDGVSGRSLGYRLLAPAEPQSWCSDVDRLARRLQAAPYPEHWPSTELFCSVLLSDGSRVVAIARYGLVDHTPGHRRGGLELIGVIGPGSLGVPSALAVSRWLRQRRANTDNLQALGGTFDLAEILAQVPPAPASGDSVPVLPVRIWQNGALLFAAASPNDPDRRLGLLERGEASNWQWLPLVGNDFPLAAFAARGPVVAWTPHLADVAVKLDAAAPTPAWDRRSVIVGLLAAAVLLAAINLGITLRATLVSRSSTPASGSTPATGEATKQPEPIHDADRFARALLKLLDEQGARPRMDPKALTAEFERLAAQDEDLRLAGPEAAEVVVAIRGLSRRSADQVEAAIRAALKDRGYDPLLVDLICRRVHEKLNGGTAAQRSSPP